jgi:hypothetical protein
MQEQGREEYSFYSFLTSALDGGEWSVSRPGRALPPEKDPRYQVGLRAGLDTEARAEVLKLLGAPRGRCWSCGGGHDFIV